MRGCAVVVGRRGLGATGGVEADEVPRHARPRQAGGANLLGAVDGARDGAILDLQGDSTFVGPDGAVDHGEEHARSEVRLGEGEGDGLEGNDVGIRGLDLVVGVNGAHAAVGDGAHLEIADGCGGESLEVVEGRLAGDVEGGELGGGGGGGADGGAVDGAAVDVGVGNGGPAGGGELGDVGVGESGLRCGEGGERAGGGGGGADGGGVDGAAVNVGGGDVTLGDDGVGEGGLAGGADSGERAGGGGLGADGGGVDGAAVNVGLGDVSVGDFGMAGGGESRDVTFPQRCLRCSEVGDLAEVGVERLDRALGVVSRAQKPGSR